MNTFKTLAGKDPEHEVKAENEPVSSTGFSQKPLTERIMGSEGKMKALHYDGPFKVSIKEIERPKVRIRMLKSFVLERPISRAATGIN